MRYLLVFIVAITLQACFDKKPFDEYDFEKTTGIEFPPKYALTEVYNNVDGRKAVVLKCDTASLTAFLHHYNFDTLKSLHDTIYIIENFIPDNQPNFTKGDAMFYKTGSAKKTSWSYVVNMNERLLWAEIRTGY